jgi:hypothetical protein
MASVDENAGKVQPLKPERAGIGEAVVAELKDILQRRGAKNPPPLDPDKWIQHCHDQELFGICLSGGGIRSATFGLGVLQGLAEKKLLSKADYISTVSGGGYIGAWLQGLASRNPDNYQELLDPERPPEASSKDPITFLRKYSNYLAPRNGLSLDALVIPLIWFRNIILNQSIIIAALMALYIVLLSPGALLRQMAVNSLLVLPIALLVMAVLATGIAVRGMGENLIRIVDREFPRGGACVTTEVAVEHVGSTIALPIFFAVLLLVFGLAALNNPKATGWLELFGLLVLFGLVALLQVGGGFCRCYIKQRETVGDLVRKWLPAWHVVWMSAITAGFLLLLLMGIGQLTADWDPRTAAGSHFVVALAPPLYLCALIVSVGLHIGLMGRDFPDASREWLVRLAALLLTYLGVWTVLFALGVFAPLGVAKLLLWEKNWWVASGTTAWILSTIMSVLAGKSGKSGQTSEANASGKEKPSTTLDLVARYGPFIAIPGFLAAVAFGTQLLLHPIPWNAAGTYLESFVPRYWEALPFSSFSWRFPLLLLAFLVFTFLVLSWRVNINEFSMHHFYKNRLVRCYLGASATKTRVRDPFTGFDPKDDLPLYKLRCQEGARPTDKVPYPIINAALTVTAGTELATQERKALPWFFTPHYSGFFPARSDEDRIARDPQSKPCYADSLLLGKGVALGTATGISGAAANPNSGFHSSPQTAFLLTLFNVRLGWWLGNPTKENAFRKAGPTFALWWLARELFGFVDESSRFLNLSDGGHFENMGLYELVRRRCRYIIVIDGEADTDYRFEGLGGAVRKCRTDFGVEIEIDPRPITPKDKFSRTHCVVGSINYKNEGETGYLLYMKSSITGNEPADVEEYRRENPEFPQQSTADQFFSESQFESYRRLGLHVARTTMDHIRAGDGEDLKKMFVRLQSQWLMPPEVPDGVFSRHGEAYKGMLKALSGSADLKTLDPIVIGKMPDWAKISDAGRTRFFFYLQLLQLIEDVFVDLDFGNVYKWNHPATQGWRTVISYWATQPEMQEIWELQKGNYGEPFNSGFNDLVENGTPIPRDQQQ